MQYVKVILPVTPRWLPTYRADDGVRRGDMVEVRMSGRKYLGVVAETGVNPGIEESRIRDVESGDTGLPAVSAREMEFWEFISSYYMCPLGDVFKAACPGGLLSAVRRKKASAEGTARPAAPRLPAEERPAPGVLGGGDRVAVYIGEAEAALAGGRTTLILAADVAAASLLRKPLRKAFGQDLLEYHSRRTVACRRDILETVRKGEEAKVILATRSALFLPFSNLGLVIVDEEQDTLHKQTKPAPRYNARDCALMLARIHSCRIVLGTALPCLETSLALQAGRYALHAGSAAPSISAEVIDISAEKRKNGMVGRFSRVAIGMINECAGKVVVVRGWEPEGELEDEIRKLFPDRNGEISVESVFNAARGVGRPDLVVVLQIDAMLGRDDFRSDEKTFLDLARIDAERIVIQTERPSHPLLQSILNGGEPDMASLMAERKEFGLPPFSRMVDVCIRDKSPKRLAYMTSLLESRMSFAGEALPLDGDGLTRRRYSLPRSAAGFEIRRRMVAAADALALEKKYTGYVYFDADPV
ncbi:MAG: hypothetical protein MJY44_03345 [Bacteroidales bacterium]|nr:hypothetical protein [Bacteroidales bacterium]